MPSAAAVLVALGAGMLLAGLTMAEPVSSALLLVGGAILLVPALRRLTPAGTFRARAGLPAAVLTEVCSRSGSLPATPMCRSPSPRSDTRQ